MRKIITVMLLGFVTLLIGCADSHQLIRLSGDQTVKLNKNGGVYVAVPKDGAYGNKVYRGSGQNVAQIIQSAFSRKARNVQQGRDYESFNKALEAAKQNGYKYLVYPAILHWEDRATEWSGISDKVEVKVEVVDTATGETVVSTLIKGSSGKGTFGGDHPQDLLPTPITEFVASLY